MSLCIDLDVERADAAVICGARSRPLVLGTSKPLRLMAAHFAPGGGFPFAGCPVGELHNTQVPLAAFWPGEAAELTERICEAQTNRERFRVLESFLMERVHASRPFNPAVRYALRQFQHPSAVHSVHDVTDQIGMSSQRFIEVFRNEVGLTPKVFARLARFRHAMRRIHTATEVDWTDIALASGYFDQPHFIRDFREFSGVSPSAYLRYRTAYNHVRIAKSRERNFVQSAGRPHGGQFHEPEITETSWPPMTCLAPK
jgi:AraC-like DNA-binding protein